MSSSTGSKKILLQFIQGDHSSLIFKNDRLEKIECDFRIPNGPFIDTIEALSQLFAATTISEELAPEEKIAFSKRLKLVSQPLQASSEPVLNLRQIFLRTVKDYDVLASFEKDALEFILDILFSKRFDPYFYTDLNHKILEWIVKKPYLSEREALFVIQLLPFIEKKSTLIYELSRRLGVDRLLVEPLDLLRLQREAFRCGNKCLLTKILQGTIGTREVPYAKDLMELFHQVSDEILLFKKAPFSHFLSLLNDLYPTRNRLIAKLVAADESKKRILGPIFIEMALELASSKESEDFLKLLLNGLGVSLFLEIIQDHLHLQYLIKLNRHSLAQLLLQSHPLSQESMQLAVHLSGEMVDAKIVETALDQRQFQALWWMVDQGAQLQSIRSIFKFNPPPDWIKHLADKKQISFNQFDLEMALTFGSPELIDTLKQLFPSFNTLLIHLPTAFDVYVRNPYATHKQLKNLFGFYLVQIDSHFKELNLAKNTLGEEDLPSKYLAKAAKNSSEFFLGMVEELPSLYRLVDKSYLLKVSLKNENVHANHLVKLIQDQAVATSSLIYQFLFIKNYVKGFLPQLCNYSSLFKEELLLLVRMGSFSNLIQNKLFFSSALLEDLFDLFAEEESSQLLHFIVDLVNYFEDEDSVNKLFYFLSSKRVHPNFKHFFCFRDVHPFLYLSKVHVQHLNREHLRFLSEIGSYQEIFGNQYLLLARFFKFGRFDLIFQYIDLDATLFERGQRPVTGSLLYLALTKLIKGSKNSYSRVELFAQLGINGLAECLRLGCRIDLYKETPNPLFAFLRRDTAGEPNLYSKSEFQFLVNYLEMEDSHRRTPLLAAIKVGHYSYALKYLAMGAKIENQGEHIFDHLFENPALSKKEILEFLYYNRIPCTHILFKEHQKGNSSFDYALKRSNDETVTWLLKLLSINLPDAKVLKKILHVSARYRPAFLIPILKSLPDDFLRTWSVPELISFYEYALSHIDLFCSKCEEANPLKSALTSYFLGRVDPNLKHENCSLFGSALKNKSLTIVLLFFKSPKFDSSIHFDVLKKASIDDLLKLRKEVKDKGVQDLLSDKLGPQVELLSELIQLRYVTKVSVDSLYDISFRQKFGIKGDLLSLVEALFQFDPLFFQMPVLEAELPLKEETGYFSDLLSLFYKYVPLDYTLADDNGDLLSRELLVERLIELLRYISTQQYYVGMPSDVPKFYAEVKNKICIILDALEERQDDELSQQVVTFIARSGPGGHCASRWDDEVNRFCDFLGPQVHPLNLSDWMLLKLNEFRVGCFYKTALKFPHKLGMNYEPHVRILLRYFIQKARNICMKGGSYKDGFGGNFKASQALKTFDSFHTCGTVYEFVLQLLNGPIKLDEKEWVLEGLKSLFERFQPPPLIEELKGQQAMIAHQIEAEFKVVRTHDFVKQVSWRDLLSHYKNKNSLLSALKEDLDAVIALILKGNATYIQLKEEYMHATYVRRMEINRLNRGGGLFKEFLRDSKKHSLVSGAVFSGQIAVLDQEYQHFYSKHLLTEAIQGVLRKYDLAAEDFSRLLKRQIEAKDFVHLAIVDKYKTLVVHSLCKRSGNNELCYFNEEGQEVGESVPGARVHFRDIVPLLLLLDLGVFKEKK